MQEDETQITRRTVWGVRLHEHGERQPGRPRLLLRHLGRLPLGSDYVQQVREVKALADAVLGITGSAPILAVDATGCGRPIADLFQAVGAPVRRVTITSGAGFSQHGADWHIAKLDLIATLQAKLHSREVEIAAALPLAAALQDELLAFRSEFTAAGNMTFNARSGKHDDILLATALALWFASRPRSTSGPVKLTGC